MVTRRSFVTQLGALTAAAPLLSEAAVAQRFRIAQAGSTAPGKLIKLDGNENPLGPPAAAIEAIRSGAGDVGRYHLEEVDAFAQILAKGEELSAKHMTVGVGSSDVIRAALCAFSSNTRPMITAAPSYDVIVTFARKLGKQVIEVPLTKQWSYPVQQLAEEARKAGGGLIYLVNPNNPTSSLTPSADIDWLAAHLPPDTVLLVDEAYLEFVDPRLIDSAVRHVRADRNVVVSRTFSKIYGMAGARAGYACARPDLTAAMADFMDNIIPVLGLRAASAAFAQRTTLVPERRAVNSRIRGELCAWLNAQHIAYIEPHGNFVMIDTGRDVKSLGQQMLLKGVAVGRPFPPLNTMLRLSVGTDAEMQRFREAFSSLRSA